MTHVTQSERQNEYRKYKSLQTKTDLNRPYTHAMRITRFHGSGISFPFTIRLYKFADNFGTPFFAPEKSSI